MHPWEFNTHKIMYALQLGIKICFQRRTSQIFLSLRDWAKSRRYPGLWKNFVVIFICPEGEALYPSFLMLSLAVVFCLSLVRIFFKVVKTLNPPSSGEQRVLWTAARINTEQAVVHMAFAVQKNESHCCLHAPLFIKYADRIWDWQFPHCSSVA